MLNNVKKKIVPYLIAPFGFGAGFTLMSFSFFWGAFGAIHPWMIVLGIGLFLVVYATVIAINWSMKK